tara:strand:- start:1044 stop:1421 length:378 start_codon:yes stop_codon:yes gene_type:complete
MKKDCTVWKIFGGYLLIILLMIVSSSANGQTYTCDEDMCVVEFNASWNAGNNVEWLHKLSDVETKRIVIDKGSWQKDFSIVVTPTIIIFVNGKETKRYQANIMMVIEEKQSDIQDKIDEIIMEEF